MKHENISEKYRKWVIGFYSERFIKQVFFIWLTDLSDKNEKDQILINKSQKIIVAKSKMKLLGRISKREIILPDSKRTKKWLRKSLNGTEISSIKFDLRKVGGKILSNKLKTKDLEKIVNFMNLYEDYKLQIEQCKSGYKSRANELDTIWNYYYEHIFFPNFNRANQKKYMPIELIVDGKKLFKEFSEMVKDFENNFEFIK